MISKHRRAGRGGISSGTYSSKPPSLQSWLALAQAYPLFLLGRSGPEPTIYLVLGRIETSV